VDVAVDETGEDHQIAEVVIGRPIADLDDHTV
jgi:hypothetical protein